MGGGKDKHNEHGESHDKGFLSNMAHGLAGHHSGYPPAPGAYPPQGYPPAPGAYPPQGYPPQGYPPQGYPGHSAPPHQGTFVNSKTLGSLACYNFSVDYQQGMGGMGGMLAGGAAAAAAAYGAHQMASHGHVSQGYSHGVPFMGHGGHGHGKFKNHGGKHKHGKFKGGKHGHGKFKKWK